MPPRGPDDDERKLLAAALAGTTRLGADARERVRAPKGVPRPRPEPLVPPITSRPLEEGGDATVPATGADPNLLRKLRRGQIAVEGKVDLHGLRTVEAFRALVGAIERAQASGRRCLLVVHGRGNHSAAGAVLRTAVTGWLKGPPLDARVLAHAPARPQDGGDGARYILLRKGP